MTKKKRKIPLFKVNIQPGSSYEFLNDVQGLKEAVIKETISAIKDGINKNKNSIPIFEIAGSDCYVEIERNKWKSSLENIIQHYVEEENYDKCIECRDLISKL